MIHGAKPLHCIIKGCTNTRRAERVCALHGYKTKRCNVAGCDNDVKGKGVCVKHGYEHRKCKMDRCEKQARKDGYCTICNPDYVPIGRLSRGAQATHDYLVNVGLPFETEKRFKNCRNILPLPFDFYLPIYKLLIEYDGKQHTQPVLKFGGQQTFELIQRHDVIKNKFAKDNGYFLLRIPHTTKISEIPHLINKAMHDSIP
jgi:very-short-patch-repair endonuclease